jgi:hypothetical protein
MSQGWPKRFKLAQDFDCKSLLTASSWANFWASPVTFTLGPGLGRIVGDATERDREGVGEGLARGSCSAAPSRRTAAHPRRVRLAAYVGPSVML